MTDQGENKNGQGTDQDNEKKNKGVLEKELDRIKRLREDVLLLRFHLARRTDITKLISDTDRLISEEALKSSLEILEWQETGKRPLFIEDRDKEEETPTTDYVAAAAASLMYSVDVLVNAARMAQEEDATGEPPFPVTPESLRASLPKADVDAAIGKKIPKDEKPFHPGWFRTLLNAALGKKIPKDDKRETASDAKTYILRMIWCTFFVFLFTLLIQIVVIYLSVESFSVKSTGSDQGTNLQYREGIQLSKDRGGIQLEGIQLSKDIVIPVTAFLWATLGSLIWILIRFRRFGAAYAFDPAHAKIYKARVFSGAITTAVLLYFVFGGVEPWVEDWLINLPLWAFVLGYAGRLQVELLRIMVERVERGFTTLLPPTVRKKKKDEPNEKER